MGGTLTVSERVLYHLNNYVRFEDKFEVPFDVTQDGVSQAISISRAHAAIELKKLRSSGMIEEHLAHVRRGKARRKAYFLTTAGKAKATTVAQYVRDNDIDPKVDPSKVVPTTNHTRRIRPYRRSSPLPPVRSFHGREKELAALRKALRSPSFRIVSVKGAAGAGKTTLAAKIASESSDNRVFWYTVKPWDVPKSLTGTLGRFFSDNGCRKLSAYLASEQVEMGELSVLLNEELSENGYLFVFDDADCAEGLQDFLAMFRHSSGAAKMLVTAEGVPRFYDKSDVVARDEVAEVELGGLDKKAALRILESRGIRGESADKLVSLTKGHPLSLEMITASGLSEARSQVARFLEERFYADLSEPERSLLQLASVFNGPFPLDAIPKELRGARKGSMLREIVPGRFEIHSSIRDFVYESMASEERAQWHSAAADHCLRSGEPHERFIHLVKANRGLEAEMMASRSGDALLDSGNVQRLWEVLRSFEPKKPRYARSVSLLRARAANMVGEYDEAWSLLESLAREAEGDVRSEALIEMGGVSSKKGELDEASRLFSDALEGKPVSPAARAKALRGLGVVEGKLGNHQGAQELLERSVREAMSAMDSRGMLLAHLELGKVFMARGMYEEAISHFYKCAAGFGPVDLARVYVDMGMACANLGRPDEARTHLTNAVKLADETGQPRTRAHALTSLSELLLRSSDLEAAKDCCFEALEVFTELNDRVGSSTAYANLGMAERMAGNLDTSEDYYKESLTAIKDLRPRRVYGVRKLEYASLLADKGRKAEARRMLQQSRKALSRCGSPDLLARVDEEIRRTSGQG